MPSCDNILVFIVALVLSAQAMPPNAGRASYTYNPDSIAQNEKILRVFLSLASGTANHLIRLKNAAKVNRESTPRPNDNQPNEESEFSVEPIEIESRMMFDEGVNNTSGHDKDNSVGKVMPGLVPQGGSVILNQTSDRPDVHGETTDENSTTASQQEVKINASGSSDHVQNEESGLSSRDLGAVGNMSQELSSTGQDLNTTEKTDEDLNRILKNQPKSTESAVSRQDLPLIGQTRNDGLDSVHQGLDAASQLKVGSPETTDLGLSSNKDRGTEIIGIDSKALEAASNLQFRSSDIANITQGLTSNGDSGNQTTGIVRDASSAALNLQSGSSGLTNVTQELLSIGQHGNQVLDETHQALETASNSQSGLSGIINTTYGPSSNSQSGNQTPTVVHKTSDAGLNVRSEGPGKFSAPQDQGGDSWNQSALLANSNQTISAINDAAKESSGSMIKAADGIGTIIRHANPTADLTSNAVDISRASSRLSMPLFRSFPDFKDEPSLIEDELLKEEEAVEDEISESQVNDFAHQFVDALRPV